MIQLYGHAKTRSLRASWALEEVSAEYQFIDVDLHSGAGRREPFISLNPAGKVPVLVDDGLVLTESAAIVTYLGDKFPQSKLVPAAGSVDRARYNQWCYFVLTELEQPLWTMAKHRFALPEARRVPAILDCANWEFARAIKLLEKRLTGPFALGDQFSAADILLGHTLQWAQAFKLETGSVPLGEYLQRLAIRPALAKAMARESAT